MILFLCFELLCKITVYGRDHFNNFSPQNSQKALRNNWQQEKPSINTTEFLMNTRAVRRGLCEALCEFSTRSLNNY